MSDPLALLPLAIAATGGRLGAFPAASLTAAGLTLLQRSAPLVRALAGRRSALLLPSGPAFLVALAASDGRGALLLDEQASPETIAWQLADAEVGAVFTLEALMPSLPDGLPLVLLDDAPRRAHVITPGRTMDVDLGSHHGLALEGDPETDGRDEECIVYYRASGVRSARTHRELLAASRAAVAELRLTSVDHVLSLLPWGDPEALAVCLAAPLLAGGRVSFLTPGGEVDMATVIAEQGISLLAGRWQTASGVRVTAARVAQGVPALRDGLLYRDER
jgi:acyl-CoA synthetase (AMP-forming)/AMP-acid ligase II